MSKIEWTGQTWNPIIGCSIVSPGCTNCYAMGMAARVEAMGHTRYEGLTKKTKAGAVWTGKVRFVEEALSKPLKRKVPTTYFVNSMSDLLHEDVPDEWIDRIFAVMALSPQHTFQVLTKRAERMREYMTRPGWTPKAWTDGTRACTAPWPLPNVWLGVSAERQKEADERIPNLLATPAAVRFVSAEPLLGPIDFRKWLFVGPEGGADFAYSRSNMLDWIIVGGESGSGARPMAVTWARSIVQQCKAAAVPVFVKQMGAFPEDMLELMSTWPPGTRSDPVGTEFERAIRLRDRKGGDMAEWPEALRIREMPVQNTDALVQRA